ncbi:MAG TPA: methylmalonyl-CoA mutase family protein, partial [Gemmatimonadaceae bacterium]|nr:methylmalonyl-CoA mutase family protein [Gemmatimonadaceae bacterium]
QTVVVGVNRFTDAEAAPPMVRPDYGALEADQIARVRALRHRRDAGTVDRALRAVRSAARDLNHTERPSEGARLMPLLVEAVRARATVGEISDTLATEWGHHGAGPVRLEHTEGARG